MSLKSSKWSKQNTNKLDSHVNPLTYKCLNSRLRKFKQILKSFFLFKIFNKVEQFNQLIYFI